MNNKYNLEELILNLSEKVDRQHEKLDERLHGVEKVLIKQETNLQEHMRRSDNLESIVQDMKKNEIEPIQKHVHMVEGALKLLGIMGLIVGLVSGIAKLLGFI